MSTIRAVYPVLERHDETVDASSKAFKDYDNYLTRRLKLAKPLIIKWEILRGLGRYDEALETFDDAIEPNQR